MPAAVSIIEALATTTLAGPTEQAAHVDDSPAVRIVLQNLGMHSIVYLCSGTRICTLAISREYPYDTYKTFRTDLPWTRSGQIPAFVRISHNDNNIASPYCCCFHNHKSTSIYWCGLNDGDKPDCRFRELRFESNNRIFFNPFSFPFFFLSFFPFFSFLPFLFSFFQVAALTTNRCAPFWTRWLSDVFSGRRNHDIVS